MGIMVRMSGSREEPPPVRSPLIARGEQVVLVLLALALVAGVTWRAINTWRLGAGPLEVIPPPEGPTFRVNVNKADWVVLALVPGLGKESARRIVEAREARGGRFDSLDDLKEVKGIGEKMVAKLRPYLYVADPDTNDDPIRMLDEP